MLNISHKLLKRVRVVGGFTKPEAELAARAVTQAIFEQLCAGEEVCLRDLCTLHFRFRKGRTLPRNNKRNGPIVQPNRWVVKFKASKRLKAELLKLEKIKKFRRNELTSKPGE